MTRIKENNLRTRLKENNLRNRFRALEAWEKLEAAAIAKFEAECERDAVRALEYDQEAQDEMYADDNR